jgi:hypothetical protein
MACAQNSEIRTYRDDAMEYDSVVVSSFRKFGKVFACLIIFREIYDLNVEQGKKKRTRGAWSQYNSSCKSPKFVSSTTESIKKD